MTVADLGSFANAARHFGLPASTISRRVARLERQLDLRLIRRTSQKLSLTDVGEVYFNHARRALDELRVGEEALQSLKARPMGRVRITTARGLTHHVWREASCEATGILRAS